MKKSLKNCGLMYAILAITGSHPTHSFLSSFRMLTWYLHTKHEACLASSLVYHCRHNFKSMIVCTVTHIQYIIQETTSRQMLNCTKVHWYKSWQSQDRAFFQSPLLLSLAHINCRTVTEHVFLAKPWAWGQVIKF